MSDLEWSKADKEVLYDKFYLFNNIKEDTDVLNAIKYDKKEFIVNNKNLSKIMNNARKNGEIHKTSTCGIRYTVNGDTVDVHINDDDLNNIKVRVALMVDRGGNDWVDRMQCNVYDLRFREEIIKVLVDAEKIY